MTGKTTTARRAVLVAALVGIFGGLGGCSSVPDEVNPVSWYRGVRDAVSGDDAKAANDRGQSAATPQAIPGEDKPFPSLATVPERPESQSTAADRAQAARSLAADREQARYSDQEIRRQTDDQGNRPRRPAAEKTAAPQPPPKPRVAPPSAGPSADVPPRSAPMPSSPGPATQSRPAVSPPPAAVAAPPPPQPPQMSPAPPPPPAILQTPSRDAPAAAATPQAAAPRPPASPASSTASSPPPAAPAPLVFGPPPADIAAVAGDGRERGRDAATPGPQAGQVSPSPSTRSMASAAFPARHSAGRKLATIYFAVGSAALGRDDRATIRRAVDAFKASGGTIHVVGHSSSRTRDLAPTRHEMANFAISLDRANAVAREIVRLGVDPSVVQVSAVSDMEPAYQEDMPSGEAGNRRAEILIGN